MNKNTSSIARRLNWSWTLEKFSTYFFVDILVIAAVIAGWCYYVEKGYFEDFSLRAEQRTIWANQEELGQIEVERGLSVSERLDRTFQEVFYVVKYDDGRSVTKSMYPLFMSMFYIGRIVLVLELFDIIMTLCFGVIGIRRKLKPLDDMAKRAEELGRIAFDESKYANLESAIEHLNPEEQDGVVSTGNKDLEGVEIAINNLLARMRESYRQQSRFVSDASHELRTPIAVIQGYANMLDRWGKDDEKVLEEGIEAIKHESEHMKTLVEQLLFLARGDAGRNHLDMQQISLKGIIHEVYEESRMIDEKHEYELVEDKGDVIMTGDAAMIKQSVRILVDNAAKYTQEGETIILKSGINKEMKAYFVIQDNGIGMNDSEVSHVFERFYRSDEARNRQTGGTGLGLSIAKWIIDRHGGYIEVLSRPEIGTRFTVTFS